MFYAGQLSIVKLLVISVTVALECVHNSFRALHSFVERTVTISLCGVVPE